MTNLQTIKSSKDFQLAKKGLFVRSHSFLIQAYQSEEKLIRVGYTVSKQNGNAIIRNKIKRRLKSIISSLIRNKKDFFKVGCNYVFIGKPNIVEATFEELKEDVILGCNNLYKSE